MSGNFLILFNLAIAKRKIPQWLARQFASVVSILGNRLSLLASRKGRHQLAEIKHVRGRVGQRASHVFQGAPKRVSHLATEADVTSEQLRCNDTTAYIVFVAART